jgi:hypothetical protein
LADVDRRLYELLTADAGVGDIASTRVYPQLAPVDAPRPFVCYQRTGEQEFSVCDSARLFKRTDYAVECCADTHLDAEVLADAVRDALHGAEKDEAQRVLVTARRSRSSNPPGDEQAIEYAATVDVAVFSGG